MNSELDFIIFFIFTLLLQTSCNSIDNNIDSEFKILEINKLEILIPKKLNLKLDTSYWDIGYHDTMFIAKYTTDEYNGKLTFRHFPNTINDENEHLKYYLSLGRECYRQGGNQISKYILSEDNRSYINEYYTKHKSPKKYSILGNYRFQLEETSCISVHIQKRVVLENGHISDSLGILKLTKQIRPKIWLQ